jgi:hypothetical protein
MRARRRFPRADLFAGGVMDDRAIRVGDWLTIDGADYRVCEFDAATNQLFLLRHGADAGEFVDADRLDLALATGRIALAARQLALAGMGDAR